MAGFFDSMKNVFSEGMIRRWARRAKCEAAYDHFKAADKLGSPSKIKFPSGALSFTLINLLRGYRTRMVFEINLDTVLPYWASRQFDPRDVSFEPRAHTLLSMNTTHRNWTILGVPGKRNEGIVDERGLLTPFANGWSVDVWFSVDGEMHPFSNAKETVEQDIPVDDIPCVRTMLKMKDGVCTLEDIAYEDSIFENIYVKASSKRTSVFIVIRPYNPEGVAFVKNVSFDPPWIIVNDEKAIKVPVAPSTVYVGDMGKEDVTFKIKRGIKWDGKVFESPSELATIAFEYIVDDVERIWDLTLEIPINSPRLKEEHLTSTSFQWKDILDLSHEKWKQLMEGKTRFSFPDERIQKAIDANVRYLLSLYDGDTVTPGPATYHSFWFRDASYLLNCLDEFGFDEIVENVLSRYSDLQKDDGSFVSQEGEWDSTGEVLWSFYRHYELCGDKAFLGRVYPLMLRGVEWIENQRIVTDEEGIKGLLPPGMSAEHLGPNDYFYWDDFWGLAGMYATLNAAYVLGKTEDIGKLNTLTNTFKNVILRSLEYVEKKTGEKIMPAGPLRRKDSAAVGSLCAAYPLNVFRSDDEWILNTINYLLQDHFLKGGLMHDMMHSGINVYLSLQIAHILFFNGDQRFYDILENMLALATSTYTWPEAINPRTGGGVMGDGYHGWATAEFLLLVRDFFAYEDEDTLNIFRFIPESLRGKRFEAKRLRTKFGTLSLILDYYEDEKIVVDLDADFSLSVPKRVRIWIIDKVLEPKERKLHIKLKKE